MIPSNHLHTCYSHGLLVHCTDDELMQGTRTFVENGLAAGAQVLVHGTRERVAWMRDVLGSHPALDYGFDEEMYLAPNRTLFAYQQKLAEIPRGREFWVTGTVPLGLDASARAAWARYESAVNEALSTFPFRAMCTYDARTRPENVIAAARATHPTVGPDLATRASPEYVDPAAFLADPLAEVPAPPSSTPSLGTTIGRLEHLGRVRDLVRNTARAWSAVSSRSIEEFVIAVNEIAANGLVHGAPPVQLTLWADLDVLTCLVEDSGPGTLDPLTGYRYPGESGPMGLWATRQLVDDLFIGRSPDGGSSVLLTKS